jgi:hypothetical protein
LTQFTTMHYPSRMPLFTRENAAILGKQGAIARWSKPRPEAPVAIPQITTPIAQNIAQPLADYAERRLNRVREQLDKIDAMAFEENDPKRLKELADASARLSDQEFKLAGRPSPGSRRPPTDKAQRAGAWGELQPALPQVAPVAAVAPVQSPAQVQPAKPMGWEYDEPNSV